MFSSRFKGRFLVLIINSLLHNIWYNAWNMKPTHRWRSCLALTCFIISTITLLLYSGFETYTPAHEKLRCHFIKSNESLPDISDFTPSVHARNIFFLETSCNSYENDKIFIKARQACAVESAAKMNPSMDIYLLYASPGIIKDENTESDRLLQVLQTYPNVKILHFDVKRLIQDTPAESLWTSGKIKTSWYPITHTSDILRLLILWKFGGIYLDLDVIITKSLNIFPDNFAGAESKNVITSSVMGFSKFGKGHEYVTACINDIRDNFKGEDWGYNGPLLITRIILSQCPKWEITELIEYGSCDEFVIFPPSAFHLVPWKNWEWFFMKNLTGIMNEYVMEKSFMIHVWNKLSYNTSIPRDEDVPYLNFAKQYCPDVVKQLDESF